MALTNLVIEENAESRIRLIGTPESRVTRLYNIVGAPTDPNIDDAEVHNALAAFAPIFHDVFGNGLIFLQRQEIQVRPTGDQLWEGIVEYSSFAPPAAGQFAFDTGGGTEHIILNDRGPTFRYAPLGKSAPDFKGLIGFNGESFDGVDLPPADLGYQFTERWILPDSQVTLGYRGTLITLGRTVNNASFKGGAAGEILFLGAAGQSVGDGTWDISFRFAAKPNKSDIDIGGGLITVSTKDGWDYLWVLTEPDVDAAAKRFVRKPIAAYVEHVFARNDFSLLGIGV